MDGEVLNNVWISGLIIFASQMVFLYLRTLNVIYTSERKIWLSILTGIGIGLAWLISIAIGVKSVLNLELVPIIGYLIGSALGTWLGFKTDKKIK